MIKNKEHISTAITLSSIITDNMVLQQGKPVPVWGKAEPGETIRVCFAGREKKTGVDSGGSWTIYLDPMEVSSTPRNMVIDYIVPEKAGTTEKTRFAVIIKNILVGEVWFCSGQSNMEMGISETEDYVNELHDSDYPEIRLYAIDKKAAFFPVEYVDSSWEECNRENLAAKPEWGGFSGVAFFFGKKLYHSIKVPVGLIQSAYAGSSIHTWIPFKELKTSPLFREKVDALEKAEKDYREEKKKNNNAQYPFVTIIDYDKLHGSMLYNAMVYPVLPYAIRGILWYQGESNIEDGMLYAEKMKILISSWRRIFHQADIPFYYVQLPPYQYEQEDALPALWDAQEACLSIKNTGMAAGIDCGDPEDIHPKQKKKIGERLALLALSKTYGKTGIMYSGPTYRSIAFEKDTAVISFNHIGSGLVSIDNKPLSCFAIAGEDMVFVPARAIISGETVIVKSEKVRNPVAVRFAWTNTAQPNLFNKEGLPARPFRTDK